MPEQLPHFGLTAPTCPCCGLQITVHQKINPGHCGAMSCNLKYAAQVGALRDAERQKEFQERVNTTLVREAKALARVAQVLDAEPGSVLIATVPFQNQQAVPLPQGVRDTFIAHIQDIVADAFKEVAQATGREPEAPPLLNPPTPIESAGCTACRGNCCRLGRENLAFLDKSVIEKLILSDPELSVSQVINRYVTAIPEQSIEEACVYQSDKGCVLPRGWRSDTCNTYRCDPLATTARRAREGDDLPFAVVGVGESASKVLAYRDSLGTIEV